MKIDNNIKSVKLAKNIENRIFKIMVLLFVPFSLLNGQNGLKNDLYQAFLTEDEKKWENLTLSFEKNANLTNTADLLTLIHCYYGWTSVQISKNLDNKATENIEKVEKWLELILKNEPNNALALNYKGVFISYQIGINKLKAPLLGKKSLTYLQKAYSLDSKNVQILFDAGNAAYYTPKIFGGNKNVALKYYKKAISIIEQQKQTDKNWIYVQLLFLESRCNELLGNEEAAKKGYEKLLKIEPNFKIKVRGTYKR